MWLVGSWGGWGKVPAARWTAAISTYLLLAYMASANHGSGCKDQSATEPISVVQWHIQSACLIGPQKNYNQKTQDTEQHGTHQEFYWKNTQTGCVTLDSLFVHVTCLNFMAGNNGEQDCKTDTHVQIIWWEIEKSRPSWANSYNLKDCQPVFFLLLANYRYVKTKQKQTGTVEGVKGI